MVLNSRGKLASRNSAPEQQAVASLRTPNEWIWISLYRHPQVSKDSHVDPASRPLFSRAPALCPPPRFGDGGRISNQAILIP